MMAKFLTGCVVAAILSLFSSASASPDPNSHIYLCFGQSNMESGGEMEEMDRSVDERFQVLADFDAPNRGWKKNMLKDLNLDAGDVPLLAGETVNADQNGACAGMNEIIAELPKTLPTAHVVSSAACTCHPDRLHFNPAGSRDFGKRYRERMLLLQGYQQTNKQQS